MIMARKLLATIPTLLLTLLIAMLMYYQFGGYRALKDEHAYQSIHKTLIQLHQTENLNEDIIKSTLNTLETRLTNHPLIWQRMGDIYQQLGWLEKAYRAYDFAASNMPKNHELQIKKLYAKSLYDKGILDEASFMEVQELLNNDPKNASLLNLIATDAFLKKDYALAIELWQKILEHVPLDNTLERNAIIKALQKAYEISGRNQDKQADQPILIEVFVDILDELKLDLKPNTSVFIFAKLNDQTGMPLAVVKKEFKDLPCQVILDQRTMMRSDVKLQYNQEVRVGARIALSGDPIGKSGDFIGVSQPFKLIGKHEVDLLINEVS